MPSRRAGSCIPVDVELGAVHQAPLRCHLRIEERNHSLERFSQWAGLASGILPGSQCRGRMWRPRALEKFDDLRSLSLGMDEPNDQCFPAISKRAVRRAANRSGQDDGQHRGPRLALKIKAHLFSMSTGTQTVPESPANLLFKVR
jgi:hypothetical protein